MTDVFISYSRKDTEFVRRLFDALKAQGRDAWVDWQGIDYSTKWWEEICAGIDRADNFVLVISPDALNSRYCHDEITYARQHGKRIIPFVYQNLDEGRWDRQPLTDQARDNWKYLKTIQFISYPKLDDFDKAVTALLTTVNTDPDHVREHTDLLAAALAWQKAGRSPGFLLRDDRLAEAEMWLAQTDSAHKEPQPTEAHRTFIAASRQAETERAQRIAADNRRTRRLRWAAIIAAIIGVLALLTTGGAVSQMVNARNNAATAQADVANAQAEGTRIGMDIMGSEAQLQASQAQAALTQGDRQTALALALKSLNNYPTVFKSDSSLALSTALSMPGREIFNAQYPSKLSGVTWNSSHSQVLAWGVDGTASVFDVKTGQPMFTLQTPEVNSGSLGGAAWSPDETRIFTLTDYTHYIWDAKNGANLLLLAQQKLILGARWNNEGTRILTWGDTGSWLWNANTGALLQKFDTGDSAVDGALWSSDETYILTWAEDSTIRVWDISSGLQQAFMQHDSLTEEGTTSIFNSIIGVVWKTDGTQILTWSTDKTARVWDAKTGERMLTLTHMDAVNTAAWSPDNKQIITASTDKTARIWDAKTGEQLRSLNHGSAVLGALWNEGIILTWEQAGVARVWQSADGAPIFTLTHSTTSHEDAVALPKMGTVASHNMRFILTWGSDLVRLWGPSSDNLRVSLPFQTQAADPYNQIDIAGAQIDEDGQHILAWTSDGAIRMWSTDSGATALTFDPQTASGGAVWSKDFQRVLTWSDDKVTIFEASTGKRLLQIKISDHLMDALWNADETRILTRSLNGNVKVWDARLGIAPAEQTQSDSQISLRHDDLQSSNVLGASFSPDGSKIATWTVVSVLRIWDALTGKMITQIGKDIPEPQQFIVAPRGVIWSADNRRLLQWTEDGILHIWDTTSGKSLVEMHHDNLVIGAAWNHDETRVLSWSLDGALRLWNVADGSPVFKPIKVGSARSVGVAPGDFAQSVMWNKDETRILVATGAGYVEVYDATTGKQLINFGQRNGRVLGTIWSPDETRVLSWSDDGSVEIGNVVTGETIVRVIHPKTVQGAAWSSDGKRILTWSWDGTARIWDAATGAPIMLLQHPAWVMSAAWNKDQTRLLTWASGDTTRIWDVTIEGMIAAALQELAAVKAAKA